MFLTLITFISAISISLIAAGYSILGLATLFAGAYVPIIAGAICGITGIFLPELLGLGTETIRSLIEETDYIGYIALLLLGGLPS